MLQVAEAHPAPPPQLVEMLGAAMLSGVAFGPRVVWTWSFVAFFFVFSFILGQLIRSIVGVLALRDDVQQSASGVTK